MACELEGNVDLFVVMCRPFWYFDLLSYTWNPYFRNEAWLEGVM